ncbi:MAG: 16S rRNA (adenine(1518)-N(6)/adenine(1519)-N(6))-dimethyltransferase RsmA [Chloroflexi bacterium]|nr:MAG: 16S rRNA (adenine(1518)-N(6)/adenine(1519)-N(6))-dimethyltransferase RsmA [Chloroflexota bacterium]
MPPSSVPELRGLLAAHGLRPKKSLGQNFLLDANILRQIVRAAEVTPDDLVIEVGPGAGTLTEQLTLTARHVIAVELDQNLVAILRQTFVDRPNVTIVHADVLQLDIDTLLAAQPSPAYKVVANLPYYITSAAIRKFLDHRHKPSLMVLMVQQEVAQRILAKPGELSLLAVSVQYYAAPTLVMRLPAGAFYPAPTVDSALVRLDVHAQSRAVSPQRFFQIVSAGFSQKRKQLRNSLAGGLRISTGESEDLLRRAGIDPQRRAQTLTLEEWERLATSLPASPPR